MNWLARLGRQLLALHRDWQQRRRILRYLSSGRVPWSEGYAEYRANYIRTVLDDAELLDRFRANQVLPDQYGTRLDERIIEYPWVFSRLSLGKGLLLDAGSALNHTSLLARPELRGKTIVIYTLAPEGVVSLANVSYMYGDLRSTVLRDQIFDEIVCISTLEHIGMDNTLIYTQDESYAEHKPEGYKLVIREFNRLLVPGGRLFVTVPFGKHEDHGWLQQFDRRMLDELIACFEGVVRSQAFYRYTMKGWRLAGADECANCCYFNIHARTDQRVPEPDYAAAARAVACLEMVKARGH